MTTVKLERDVTDAIWLRRLNYHVMPLNPRLGGHVLEVERAIERGIPAHPDLHRHEFYLLELNSGWVYIHVRENARTVYVVAHSRHDRPHASPARVGSEMVRQGAVT
jgi:hypothetical protein